MPGHQRWTAFRPYHLRLRLCCSRLALDLLDRPHHRRRLPAPTSLYPRNIRPHPPDSPSCKSASDHIEPQYRGANGPRKARLQATCHRHLDKARPHALHRTHRRSYLHVPLPSLRNLLHVLPSLPNRLPRNIPHEPWHLRPHVPPRRSRRPTRPPPLHLVRLIPAARQSPLRALDHEGRIPPPPTRLRRRPAVCPRALLARLVSSLGCSLDRTVLGGDIVRHGVRACLYGAAELSYRCV